ncbi:tryptophan synthase [Penicillium verhagenii]|nr:tryptophan synthase [Penicillium verhagenii]
MESSRTVLQDDDGKVLEADFMSPYLGHPGVVPELAYWNTLAGSDVQRQRTKKQFLARML